MQTTITLPQLGSNLAGMATRSANLLPVLQAVAVSAVSEIKDRFQSGTGPQGERWAPLKYPRPLTGGNDRPLLNQGLLQASFTSAVTANSLTIGTAKQQAPLMHYGGTITPKKGKFLAIPVTVQAARAGSPRRFSQPLSPRISKGGAGGVLLDPQGTVQYVLTKKVTVPPRPFMGFSDQWMADFQAILTNYLTTGRL